MIMKPALAGLLVLTGAIAIGEGALYLDELYRRFQIVELDNPLLYDVVDTSIVALQSFLPPSQNPFVKNLIINDLRVDVSRESWLRSRDLNVEVTGELNISFIDSDPVASQRTPQDVRLLGTLTAVRGNYTLYSIGTARQFNIREGTVEFPGTPGMDPALGFNAVYRARPSQGDPIDIVAVVGGIGAAIGLGIDAAWGPKTVYRTSGPARTVSIAPIAGMRSADVSSFARIRPSSSVP